MRLIVEPRGHVQSNFRLPRRFSIAAWLVSSVVASAAIGTTALYAPGLYAQGYADHCCALQDEQVPEGFLLDAEANEWIDELLEKWEQASLGINTFECDFQRWQFLPQLGDYRDPESGRSPAYSVARGTIRFASPDQTRFEVDEVWHLVPPRRDDEQPDYQLASDSFPSDKWHEHWLWKGSTVFEFDFANSRLNEIQLATEARPQWLGLGPAAFLLNFDSEELKSRFWLRPWNPDEMPAGYYGIEAVRKPAEGLSDYGKIQWLFSDSPCLPVRVEVFAVDYDTERNPSSTAFVFENRQIDDPSHEHPDWVEQNFSSPEIPPGWERFQGTLLGVPPQ